MHSLRRASRGAHQCIRLVRRAPDCRFMSAVRDALWVRAGSQPAQPDLLTKAASSKGPRPRPHRRPSPRKAARPSPAPPPVQDDRPDPLCFRGRQYARLSKAECATVRNLLEARLPALPRLKEAGYSFPLGKRFKESPTPTRAAPRRTAVVLGCELAVPQGTRQSARELLHVTAIDLFSGELLLDSLATPAQKIADYRTDAHGITAAGLEAAARAGRALPGFGAARAELAKHVDLHTVLVGHDLGPALRVLRLRHARVLDTSVLASDAAVGFAAPHAKLHGLPRLARELLGFDDVRAAPDQPHRTLEHVLVARELALWCLRHPTELGVWATDALRKFYMGL